MPHICTRCNNIFESGEDILKGCPVCGWKKFMFTRTKSAGIKGSEPQTQQIITRAMGVRVPPGGRAEEREERVEEIVRKPSEKPFQPSAKGPEGSKASASIHEAIPEGESEKPESEKLESIKITAPGTYELNLPSLFEREELIMAVKEGTYFIDLSSAFRKGKKE
ncbi:MAG TPA: Zn-ribbon domain-containing protein [Methanotrichaceae archaeon]|nr:Zn-ribbon domain-containing protein [Methanotrichaceae archaeon]